MRKALRSVGKTIQSQIRSNITWNSKVLRRSVKIKMKSYQRGRVIWMGVGFPAGDYADWRTPVKAHAYDRGWVPYPKGRPTNTKGKGWRRGKRRLGGQKIYNTRFISKVYESAMENAQQKVYDAVIETIQEMYNG